MFKFLNFSLRLRFLAKYSFFGQCLSRRHFQVTYSRQKGVPQYTEVLLDCYLKAWYDSPGIAVDGCLLTYLGPDFCDTCKSGDPKKIHNAKFKSPFTPETPRFEVRF